MQPCASKSDECFEVLFEFLVASGESAEVFEPGEAAFDAVALSIEFFIVSSLLFSVGFGGTTATAPTAWMWFRIAWLS